MDWRTCTGVLLLLAGIVPGCATRRPVCCHSGGREAEICGEHDLTVGPPTALEPDVTELDSADLEGFGAVRPGADGQYWVLRPAEVQCFAAAAAPLANVIRSEDCVRASDDGPRSAEAEALRSQWLAYRAVDERNKAAGRALEVFYLLAEVEASQTVLSRGFNEIDEAIANLERLRAEGIQIAADQDTQQLHHQRIALVGRRLEADVARRRLNGQLRQMMGLTVEDPLPIWPAADLRVTTETLEVESAVGVGMEMRPELGLLRQLVRSVNADTLAFVRAALGQIDGTLGLPALSARRFRAASSRSGEDEEVYVRRHQLRELLESQEGLAAEEIRGAALDVTAALHRIALAKAALENTRHRVSLLEQKRGTAGGPTIFDVNAAEMLVIEAERDLIHQVIAWRIAQVKLEEAQGLLAPECGYELPTRCGDRNR